MRPVVRPLLPGLVLCAVVALAAVFLARHYGAPVMLMALLLGLALNFLSEGGPAAAGIGFTARTVLRLGVALLGLRITIDQVVALGWSPVLMVVVSVWLTLALGIGLARLMGFQTGLGLLTGGAVGICGASAALALSAAWPAHPRKDQATLFTVIGVSTLSTGAMVLYPLLTQALGLDARNAGYFLGGTIHDVAQVVGAGYSLSPEAGDAATLVKLLRVAMLVPVIVLTTTLARRQLRQRPDDDGAGTGVRPPLLPGFLLAFVVLVALNSTGWLPQPLVQTGQHLSQACLIAAMAAIGLKTRLQDVLTVGWKPVALMLAETAFLAVLVGMWLKFLG